MLIRSILLIFVHLSLLIPLANAQQRWQKPPAEILEVLHAPELPYLWLNPTGDTAVLGTSLRYPPIAELAKPYYKLAGIRLLPGNNGHHNEWNGNESVAGLSSGLYGAPLKLMRPRSSLTLV
ncbi:hypothetical protein ACFL27_27000 [candidate division CSSED10-310 bacterium]|uniref:Uncharacterized protein n=1 Tax=candidate division CSSED10-310 bacterium TaxID=2855610 RepID=A0ABV6Z5Y1_UNCC1